MVLGLLSPPSALTRPRLARLRAAAPSSIARPEVFQGGGGGSRRGRSARGEVPARGAGVDGLEPRRLYGSSGRAHWKGPRRLHTVGVLWTGGVTRRLGSGVACRMPSAAWHASRMWRAPCDFLLEHKAYMHVLGHLGEAALRSSRCGGVRRLRYVHSCGEQGDEPGSRQERGRRVGGAGCGEGHEGLRLEQRQAARAACVRDGAVVRQILALQELSPPREQLSFTASRVGPALLSCWEASATKS